MRRYRRLVSLAQRVRVLSSRHVGLYLAALVIATLLAGAAIGVDAQTPPAQPAPDTVAVAGNATVTLPPDLAMVQGSVQTQADTAGGGGRPEQPDAAGHYQCHRSPGYNAGQHRHDRLQRGPAILLHAAGARPAVAAANHRGLSGHQRGDGHDQATGSGIQHPAGDGHGRRNEPQRSHLPAPASRAASNSGGAAG